MKNIFSQLSTLIPAHQRTNIVILKSAIVTSILKNLSSLSLRAKRGNLLTSFHSFHLAQSTRRKAHGVFFPQLSTINHQLLTLFAHSTKRTAHGVFFPQLSTLNHQLLTLLPVHQPTSVPAYQRTILLLFLLLGFVVLNAQTVGELGRWEYGPTEAVAVKGNTAYISSGSYLWVMDISDESNPRLISETKLENYINYIRRIGNYLYVSKNDTLLNIYDIHTDTMPMLVNQIEGDDSDFPWKEIISTGDTLYTSGYFNRQYFINDTVNPIFTRIVGFTRDIDRDSTIFAGTMQGDREIRVYDLSQTGDIYDQTDDYYTTESVRGIKVSYPYVYFGYGSKGIGIMDINNLYDIKLNKTVTTDGYTYDVEMIEETLLIAARGQNGIGIYDVEDDTVLTEIGECETNGYTYELEVIGNRLYVGAKSGGLIIVDIADKSNPMVLGEYRGYGECRRMAIEGDRMYVASGDGGVMIMDITDRENPEVISQCWTRGIGEDVVKEGDYLYVADGDSGLTVVDIADENNPNVVTGLLTGYYQDLIDMYGNMLALGLSYTTASEISIIDIGNPLNPIKASGVMNGCFGFNMMFDSIYLHANASGGTVPRYKIIDLSNMYSPIEKDSVMQAFSGYDGIFIKDNKSYMYYEDSFYCYDVSDVNNISELGRRYRSGYTEIIRMSGDILFDYVYQGHMVNIWDYTVPTSPDSIASVQLRHYSYDIEPKDEYVYATLGNVTTDQIGKGIYGLSIYGFDMTPPSRITLIEPQDGDTAYNNEMNVTWHKSTDTGVGIDRYEVYVNGTERGETTDTSMTVNISDTGTRNVWVKTYDRVGNSSYSDTNAVYLLMGIEDKGKTTEITKELTIRAMLNKISIYNGTGEKQEVEVLDVMGRVVEKKELKQKEQYELSPKSGIYFIRSGIKKKTSKVAIIR